MSIKGKTAIVTGAQSGIGEAAAVKLAAHGANVIVNYLDDQEAGERVAQRCSGLGVTALALKADVSSDSDCRWLAAEAVAATGRIDILVNCAGVTKHARHADLDALQAEDFLTVYKVNLVGPWQMTRACAPHMKAGCWGAVVNIASIAALHGIGSSAAYAASKGALLTATKSLARSLAPEIRVNAISPGFVGTPWFSRRMGKDAYAAMIENVESTTPLAYAASAEDIAEGILFLVGAGARTMTGQNLVMDAGAHLAVAAAGDQNPVK